MARKKNNDIADETSEDTGASHIGELETYISKQFGQNLLVSAKSIQEQPKQILSISPCFDLGAGGGISEGTMTLLCGAPKCGKTSTALHIAKKAQALGKHIYWLDVEHRLKSRDLSGIPDLDLDKFTVISSKKVKF